MYQKFQQKILRPESFAFLTDLLQARAPSGFEAGVQEIFLAYCAACGATTQSDAYGNAWAVIGDADAPLLMITGHGDEIGLMVSRIEDNGFVRFHPIGGVDPETLISRRVWLRTDAQKYVAGVVGALPIHLQDADDRKVPKMWDLFLDVGADSADEVQQKGIKIGDWITLQEGPVLLSDSRITSRALDNRIGIYAAAETLRLLSLQPPKGVRVAAVSTVQEEIGGVGAEMVTRQLSPAAALVVDVTHATDIPGCNQNRYGAVKLGGGPTLTHGSANHPGLVRHLQACAQKEKIQVQQEASSRYTGTDADNIYRRGSGVPSALISLPNRYMHTTAETSSLSDLEAIPRLLCAAVTSFDTAILHPSVQP